MRALWSGALSFGLVNIPVKLYSATNEHELKFNLLHKKDLQPVRYARVCRSDGREIPYEDIVKGYQYEKGDYIVLDDEDFKKANARKTKTIDIVDFTEETEIDTIFYQKPYYLEPEKGAERPYALLRDAIAKSKKVGVAKFVIRNKEHLAVIKPMKNVLVLNQLRFEDEIRDPGDLNIPGASTATTKSKSKNKPALKVTARSAKELDVALALINHLTETFKPQDYHDTYTEELKEIIEEKAKGKPIHKKGAAPKNTNVADLMAALQASLEKEKQHA
ncbi:MAG: hypothetical protein JWO40_339 [Candidatus Doudnabacteria bacterium]|nr:hypothetical protein [Candidatus Doudnabacteria bacterium]